jgi:hypothetical protein
MVRTRGFCALRYKTLSAPPVGVLRSLTAAFVAFVMTITGLGLVVVQPANALDNPSTLALLAAYNPSGTSLDSSSEIPASSTSPGLSLSNLRQVGTTATAPIGNAIWPFAVERRTFNGQDQQPDGSQYMSFTITPDPGTQVNLRWIAFCKHASSHPDGFIQVRSGSELANAISLSQVRQDGQAFGSVRSWTGAVGGPSPNLIDLHFNQDFRITAPTEFRILMFNYRGGTESLAGTGSGVTCKRNNTGPQVDGLQLFGGVVSLAPTISSFSSNSQTPRNNSDASYSLNFSEAVTGLEADDIVNAGTATGCVFGVSGSGSSYTVTVSSCSDGTIQPRLNSNSVTGSAFGGPKSAVTATTTITVDSLAPTASAAAVTLTAGNTGVLAVGSTGPGGGRVFYQAPVGFACGPNLTETCHYLEAAPTSGTNAWTVNSFQWSGLTTTLVSPNASAIGTGYQNTLAMIAQSNTVSGADTSAQAYRGPNNQNDWYLPSKDELNAMYLDRVALGMTGGYWSSTQHEPSGSGNAWYQDFGNGTQGAFAKSQPFQVRPIRAMARSHLEVQSTETGTAYLVNESVTVTDLASITSSAGNLWNSANVTAANTNTALSAAGLISGTYRVYTVDAAGNLSAASANAVTINPASPGAPDLQAASDLGASSTDNITSDNTPTFDISGLEVGVDVTITATPTSAGSPGPVACTFTSTGASGSCTFPELVSGTYTFRAVQARGALVSTFGPALANVVINSTALPAPQTPDLDAASDSGESNTDNITNDNTPTINIPGSFAGTALVRATKSGTSDVTCTVALNASTRACTLGTLVDGVWSISVTDTDTAGNSATSAALSVTIDTTPPVPTVAAQDVVVGSNVSVQSSEPGTAYLVISQVSQPGGGYGSASCNNGCGATIVSHITGASDSRWNSVQISAANTPTLISTAGLLSGIPSNGDSYYLRVADVAGNLSLQNSQDSIVKIWPGAKAPAVVNNLGPSGTRTVGQTMTNRLTFSGVPTPTVSYQWVRCSSISGSNWESTCVDIPNATTTSYTLTDADFNHHMGVRATAVNSAGTLVQMAVTSGAVTAIAPGVPTFVSATITGATTATVTFNAPASTGGAAISGYTVTSNPAGAKCVVGVNATTYECTRLTPNTTYTFRVKATNSAGTGADSLASSPVTTQAAPTLAVSKYDTNQNLRGPNDTPITIPSGWVTLTEPCANHSQYFSYSFSLADTCRSINESYGEVRSPNLVLNNGNSPSVMLNFVDPVSSFIFDVAAVDAVSPNQVHMLVFYDDSNPDSFYVGNSGFISHPITANGASSTRYQVSFPDGRPIKKIGLGFNSNGTGGVGDTIIFDNFSFVVAPLSATASVSTKSFTAGTAVSSFTPITAAGGIGWKDLCHHPGFACRPVVQYFDGSNYRNPIRGERSRDIYGDCYRWIDFGECELHSGR